MTIKKKIAAIAAAAMMAMSMTAISASAVSTPDSFELHYYDSTDKTTHKQCIVTNLDKKNDSGIDFKCTKFEGGTNVTYVEGDLVNYNLKKNTSELIMLNGKFDQGTILFSDGWFEISGGTVLEDVTLRNYSPNVIVNGTVS